MGKYVVYATESFQKLYLTLSRSEQEWVQKIKNQLVGKPAGKSLHFNWFREKKHLNKRLYFLVDYDKRNILLMAFAPKKDQQKIIDFVITNKDELLKHLSKL